MGMADVLAKAESPTSLKTIITDILKQEETKEPLDPSNPNHRLSISAIASLCPREEVICGLKKISRVRVIDVGLGTAFKTGHALHEVMQGSILSESPCFLGMWSCLDMIQSRRAMVSSHAQSFAPIRNASRTIRAQNVVPGRNRLRLCIGRSE